MGCPITTEEYLYRSIRENLIAQGYILATCFLTIVGASIIVAALYKSSSNLTPHLILVASLCFADVILTTETALFLMFFNKEQNLIEACKVDTFFSTFGVLSSTLSFGMITVERYMVICRGLQNHTIKTLIAMACAYTYITIFASVISSSSDYIDIAVGSGYLTVGICRPRFCSRDPLMITFLCTAIIILGLFIVSVIYLPYQILKVYALATAENYDSIQIAENKVTMRERKLKERAVFIRLSIITGVFVVMVSPLALSAIYEVITGNVSPPALLNIYLLGLASNCALNPILLYNFDVTVRSRVDSMFGIVRNKKKVTSQKTQASNGAGGPQRSQISNKGFGLQKTRISHGEYGAASTILKDTVRIAEK